MPPGVGERIPLEVLGLGRVPGIVERVDDLVQEGVRGLAWRVTLRLPDGTTAEGSSAGAPAWPSSTPAIAPRAEAAAG